jgi:hypothetical protein
MRRRRSQTVSRETPRWSASGLRARNDLGYATREQDFNDTVGRTLERPTEKFVGGSRIASRSEPGSAPCRTPSRGISGHGLAASQVGQARIARDRDRTKTAILSALMLGLEHGHGMHMRIQVRRSARAPREHRAADFGPATATRPEPVEQRKLSLGKLASM